MITLGIGRIEQPVNGHGQHTAAASNGTASARARGVSGELGNTGLRRGSTGIIFEEFLRDLQGDKGLQAYKEMAANDPIVGAVLYAIDKIIRNVTWTIQGPTTEWNDFIETCREDMSQTWEDFLSEVLSMLVFGWSWFEIVYKRRGGQVEDPSRRSQYTDGKIGWRKLAIRSQDSKFQWLFGSDGGVQAFVQRAPPLYQTITIPIETSLLFRTVSSKNNPEGASILRSAYRPWFFRKRIEEIEGIGIERDLAGLPVVYASADVLAAYREQLQDIVVNLRRNEQEGVILPMLYDDKGNKMCTLELLSSGGQRQLNTSEIIKRYNNTIATTCLADFILLGQDKVGSFALSTNKSDLFALSIGTYLKHIAGVLNRYAIPRLLAFNGVSLDPVDMPYFQPGHVQAVDLTAMGDYIYRLSQANMLTPDPDLENYLRDAAELPERDENAPMPAPRIPGGGFGQQPDQQAVR